MAVKRRPVWNYHKGVRTTLARWESYYICDRCGAEITEPNASKRKYCAECAKIVRREKAAERVKRHRRRKSEQNEPNN